jgi:hypothetical protein
MLPPHLIVIYNDGDRGMLGEEEAQLARNASLEAQWSESRVFRELPLQPKRQRRATTHYVPVSG